MKIACVVFGLTAAASTAVAQNQPILGEDAVKVSDHVWAIMGWPNIGIVVGTDGALVVDTGLGPRNGATIANVVQKLAPGKKLYLTTTHFHPEHASGDAGFPAGTVLIRDKVQQQEMDQRGAEMVKMFAGRNEQFKELLADVKQRPPDETFDRERVLDLGGGVKARLLWFGAAHTKGDELTLVEPDATLISGDVVQNKTVPNVVGGSAASWIAVLDQVAKLDVRHVLPDHSAPGDGSLVTQEKAFIADLQARALDLKNRGVSVADAGKQLTTEFKARYPDWGITNLAGFVRSVYSE
jgi:glyoxylase-like metal-dependent hydrolase (beta-lactamase superfamily II)